MGSLAMEPPTPGMELQGILVKRNFNYHILAPADLNSEYNDPVTHLPGSESLEDHIVGAF